VGEVFLSQMEYNKIYAAGDEMLELSLTKLGGLSRVDVTNGTVTNCGDRDAG